MNERPLHIRVMSQIRGHSPDNMSKPWGRTHLSETLFSKTSNYKEESSQQEIGLIS